MVHTPSDKAADIRYELMLLEHKNVWSSRDYERRRWLMDEIEEESKGAEQTA